MLFSIIKNLIIGHLRWPARQQAWSQQRQNQELQPDDLHPDELQCGEMLDTLIGEQSVAETGLIFYPIYGFCLTKQNQCATKRGEASRG